MVVGGWNTPVENKWYVFKLGVICSIQTPKYLQKFHGEACYQPPAGPKMTPTNSRCFKTGFPKSWKTIGFLGPLDSWAKHPGDELCTFVWQNVKRCGLLGYPQWPGYMVMLEQQPTLHPQAKNASQDHCTRSRSPHEIRFDIPKSNGCLIHPQIGVPKGLAQEHPSNIQINSIYEMKNSPNTIPCKKLGSQFL